MREVKRIISLTVFIVLFAPFAVFAGTVGDPASTNSLKGPGVFSLKQNKNVPFISGSDFEFLFDRDIHANAATNAEFTSGEWYMTGLSYVMFDRVAPYVKLGVAHLKARWEEPGAEVKLESDTNFAWGAGAKALIWEFKKPKIKFVTDGFYRVADLDAEEGHYAGSKIALDPAGSRFLIREWQIALLIATELDIGAPTMQTLGVSKMVPYIGVKYSDINGSLRQARTNGDYHNPGVIDADDNFGIFAGCDLVGPSDSVSLSLEGRLLDETALTAGVAVLF